MDLEFPVWGAGQTHWEAASVSAPVHPLHVHHGPEQTDVVVGATERLHALEQLERRQEAYVIIAGATNRNQVNSVQIRRYNQRTVTSRQTERI